MRPSYIILTESGQRLDLANGYEFNPNEFAIEVHWDDVPIGFYFATEYPSESYCYSPDIEDPDEEPVTATTIAFKAYDENDNLICEAEGGSGLWL